MQESVDGDMSVPAGSDMTNPPDDGSMKFPAFEGKDLDGESGEERRAVLSGNAVTVVNFWFTTANPCVGELAELTLNKERSGRRGSLASIRLRLTATKTVISEAKDAGQEGRDPLSERVFSLPTARPENSQPTFAYPTTYVVDRAGNIVG